MSEGNRGNPHPTRKDPPPPGPGRPKGSRNKLGVEVKASIMWVFTNLGGIPTMTNWARRNKTEFYKIYARLIPTEIVAKVIEHDASELSDAELAVIASAGSIGIAGPEDGEPVSHELH